MFAARSHNHNENAIYNHQTAAAAKPLNQGIKALAPKTPGKTKANDENAALAKTGRVGKAAQGKEGGEKSAFVTPAGMSRLYLPLLSTISE